jgi:hypothetical protein
VDFYNPTMISNTALAVRAVSVADMDDNGVCALLLHAWALCALCALCAQEPLAAAVADACCIFSGSLL